MCYPVAPRNVLVVVRRFMSTASRIETAFDDEETAFGVPILCPPQPRTCYVSFQLLASPQRSGDLKHASRSGWPLPLPPCAGVGGATVADLLRPTAVAAATTIDEDRRTVAAATRVVVVSDILAAAEKLASESPDEPAEQALCTTRASCRHIRLKKSAPIVSSAGSERALAAVIETWLQEAVAPELALPDVKSRDCLEANTPLLSPDTTVVAPRSLVIHSRLVAKRTVHRGGTVTTLRRVGASHLFNHQAPHIDAMADFDSLFSARDVAHIRALCGGTVITSADLLHCQSYFDPEHLCRCCGLDTTTDVPGHESFTPSICAASLASCCHMRRLVERFRGKPISAARALAENALSTFSVPP